MEIYETIPYKGYNINIHFDTCASNPFEEFDQLGVLYQNRRDSHSNGKQLRKLKEFDDGNGYIDWKRLKRDYIWLRVYSYEHSGICLKTSRNGNPFSCPWDSGFYGIIARRKDEIRNEYGWKLINNARRKLIETYFENEIELYSEYLEGNVFGYTVTDDEDNELDSCWGFYGMDHEKSGLFEYAKGFIDYQVSKQSA